MDLRIAYEDEHLVVVDKPAGLVVHPAPGPCDRDARARAARARHRRRRRGPARDRAPPRPRHVGPDGRRALGGGARRLQELVRSRELERHYLALVVGRPRSRSGRIEAPIGRDRRDPMRHSLDTDTPREAVTHFEVVELLPAARAPRREARDGPHPPDPRPPGGDRPAGRRRSGVRPAARARSRAPVPARGPPRLHASRSRVRRSTWSRRCRKTCKRPLEWLPLRNPTRWIAWVVVPARRMPVPPRPRRQ